MGESETNELEDIVDRLAEDSESARTLKFLLFREDYPIHKVKVDLGVSDCIIVSFLSLLLSTLGFVVWGQFTILGFIIYYVAVCAIMLETLHIIYDR
jgi:hypothetical protein